MASRIISHNPRTQKVVMDSVDGPGIGGKDSEYGKTEKKSSALEGLVEEKSESLTMASLQGIINDLRVQEEKISILNERTRLVRVIKNFSKEKVESKDTGCGLLDMLGNIREIIQSNNSRVGDILSELQI